MVRDCLDGFSVITRALGEAGRSGRGREGGMRTKAEAKEEEGTGDARPLTCTVQAEAQLRNVGSLAESGRASAGFPAASRRNSH